MAMNLRNMLTIARLTLKGIWNNKFAFFIIVFTPMIICINFGYVAFESPAGIKTIILVDLTDQDFGAEESKHIAALIGDYTSEDGSMPFSVSVLPGSAGQASQLLDAGQARAVIYFSRGSDDIKEINVIVDTTEPVLIAHFERGLSLIIEEYSSELSAKKLSELADMPTGNASASVPVLTPAGALKHHDMSVGTTASAELIFFDFFASAVIVLVALSLPLALSSLSITFDRNMGVLERVFATPYKKSEIVVGKMVANSIISLVITTMILLTLRIFFNVVLGNIAIILLLAILIAVNGVILGLFISATTGKDTQSLLAAMISLLLFMSTMTFLWPLETMHPLMQLVSRFTPYIYGTLSMRSVNMIGAGFYDIWPNILILLFFIMFQALLAIGFFRRRIT